MSEVRKFLEALYGYSETGVFSLFCLPSRRAHFFDIDPDLEWIGNVEAKARRLRDQHVYFGVGPLDERPSEGRGSEGDVGAIPGLWLDVDVAGAGHQSDRLPPSFEDAMGLIYEFPFPPTTVVYSGGGLHAYWLFLEPWVLRSEEDRAWAMDLSERFQRHMMALASFSGWHVDPTYDLARILRLPGTINQKYGREVELVELDEGQRYEPHDLGAWLADFALEPSAQDSGGELWQGEGATSSGGGLSEAGGRNNRLKAIVAACLDRGETLEDTVFEALKYDSEHHRPPLFGDPTEFRSTHDYTNALRFVSNVAESINRRRQRQGDAPQRFRFTSHESAPELLDSEAEVNWHNLGAIYRDDSPEPPDLIGGGLVGPGEFTLIAGPPKSMKSMFAQDLMISAALGRPFLERFRIPRQLTSAFINMEMSYRVLRRRVQALGLHPHELNQIGARVRITERFGCVLDDAGAERMVDLLGRMFPEEPPDLICFDPLINLFSGENENDNPEMMKFLKRMDSVRDRVNPKAGLILVHHTAKVGRRDMQENPFNAIRGASSLRGHYSSGILIMQESEDRPERRVFFDVRIEESPEPITVRYDENTFIECVAETRLAGERQGARYDREARRKKHVIIRELEELAKTEGRLLTGRQFAEVYANQKGMGSDRSIQRKISELTSKGYLAYCDGRDLVGCENVQMPHPNSSGFLVCEGMELMDFDPIDGEVHGYIPLAPTHKKHPDTGAIIEFDGWVYQDDDDPLFDGESH